ncbi:MAG: RNA-directed DNA polymerase [Clostridia bacterium]|nr:RNA-directed DNA polymerase [Clostridia bacterium]
MDGFTNIASRNELADFLRIPRKKLTHILYIEEVNNLYTSFDIPKKSGEKRHINAPTDDLKSVQKRLAYALWEHQKNVWEEKDVNPNISHGFEKNKSIITNSRIHRNKRLVLNIDLENFFDSFHFGRIRGFFDKNIDFKVPIEVATVIAQLSCYKGCLPQGAPSSPILTNLIGNILDIRLLKLAKQYKLDYTRYADDLTFSTNNRDFLANYPTFIKELSIEIESSGFRINHQKTRLQYRDSKQVVTGLIVNQKINVDKCYYKVTRAMAHSLYSKGGLTINGKEGTINQLEGRFSFIDQIERYNNTIDEDSHDFRNLNGREEQYRKFLFFKYFFSNSKPLIATEGKTDVAYLKAALKNLFALYPDLISKTESDDFEFKVSFLRRTKRLRYFFGLSLDGADTLKNVYNFYTGKEGLPNYLKYFNVMSSDKPKNPVILLFDNELANKNKPLYKLVNNNGLNETQKKDLSDKLNVKISENLFLLTHPLAEGKDECEIENLFDIETLSHVIEGKTLSLDSKFDNNLYYGKEIFSKYISSNYKDIDFSGFRQLLDKLNEIITTFNST